MKIRPLSVVAWLCVVLCMVAIFMFSSQNGTKSGNTSESFIKVVLNTVCPDFRNSTEQQQDETIKNIHLIVRKLAHFTVFCVLGISLILACIFSHLTLKKSVIISLVWSFSYASFDEIHQSFIPNRGCSFVDVLIDFSGAVFGVLIVLAIYFIVKKVKANKQNKVNKAV